MSKLLESISDQHNKLSKPTGPGTAPKKPITVALTKREDGHYQVEYKAPADTNPNEITTQIGKKINMEFYKSFSPAVGSFADTTYAATVVGDPSVKLNGDQVVGTLLVRIEPSTIDVTPQEKFQTETLAEGTLKHCRTTKEVLDEVLPSFKRENDNRELFMGTAEGDKKYSHLTGDDVYATNRIMKERIIRSGHADEIVDFFKNLHAEELDKLMGSDILSLNVQFYLATLDLIGQYEKDGPAASKKAEDILREDFGLSSHVHTALTKIVAPNTKSGARRFRAFRAMQQTRGKMVLDAKAFRQQHDEEFYALCSDLTSAICAFNRGGIFQKAVKDQSKISEKDKTETEQKAQELAENLRKDADKDSRDPYKVYFYRYAAEIQKMLERV